MHDIDEKAITEQVLHRLQATPNSRVRELLASLVKSVHQFTVALLMARRGPEMLPRVRPWR
jgi:hypothetical protein